MGGAFTPCVFQKALQEDLSQERKIQVPKFNFPHFLPHPNPKLFSCHFPSHCIILCLSLLNYNFRPFVILALFSSLLLGKEVGALAFKLRLPELPFPLLA